MANAGERAWQEWRAKISPEYKRWGVIDVERAFLAGWATREAELAQARELLRQALYQVCEVEGWDVPWWAEKWAPAVDTFLEATDGSADRG